MKDRVERLLHDLKHTHKLLTGGKEKKKRKGFASVVINQTRGERQASDISKGRDGVSRLNGKKENLQREGERFLKGLSERLNEVGGRRKEGRPSSLQALKLIYQHSGRRGKEGEIKDHWIRRVEGGKARPSRELA